MKANNIVTSIQNKISKFNEICFPEFEQFLMGKFFAISYYEVIDNQIADKNLIRLGVENLIRCFIIDTDYDFNHNFENRIILFYSHAHAMRKDYIDMMEDTAQLLDGSCFSGRIIKKHLVFDKTAFNSLHLLRKWKQVINKIEKDKKIQAHLLAKTINAFRWKCLLENNKNLINKIKGLVTIFDAREHENIFTQYCKSLNIKAATLQHGHFNASSYIDDSHYSYGIAFEGFVSDEIWVWGEYTYLEAIENGIQKNKIIKAGYPKRISTGSSSLKCNTLGVVLDLGESTTKTNLELLNIASKYLTIDNHYSLIIKPHPGDKTDYIAICNDIAGKNNVSISWDSIASYSDHVDVSICCSSTAYIDLLCLGKRVYRFVDSNNSNYQRLNSSDTFKNFDELVKLINENGSEVNLKNKEFLVGRLEERESNYRKAAERLFKP